MEGHEKCNELSMQSHLHPVFVNKDGKNRPIVEKTVTGMFSHCSLFTQSVSQWLTSKRELIYHTVEGVGNDMYI